MGERILRPEDMASTSTAVATTVSPPLQEPQEPVAVITLRPGRPARAAGKKVLWTEDTVDNEHMNKKKSKCCCIYEKPHKFGESDSEDSDAECEHCFGHVERRRRTAGADQQDSAAPVATATVTVQPPEGSQEPTEPDPQSTS